MDSSQEMGTNDVFLWLAAGNKEPKDAIKTASFLSCLLYVETTLGHRFLCLVKVQWLNKGEKNSSGRSKIVPVKIGGKKSRF